MSMTQNQSNVTSHSINGRVALITGANTGIGRVTARELFRQGAHVFVACRSPERARDLLEELEAIGGNGRVQLLKMDLADFDSIRKGAAEFLATGLPLHLLINNAGLAGTRGLSKSGFEMTFGVNHLGHFLLTQLLLDRIRQSAPARIVTVASRAHYRAAGIDWEALCKPTQTSTGLVEYGVSKLANVLFSAELGRRLQGSGVQTYSLHPGVVATDVWRSVPQPFRALAKLFMISSEEGARTTLYCASSAEVAEQTGLYYDKCQVRTPSALGRDVNLAAELWRRSEAWVSG